MPPRQRPDRWQAWRLRLKRPSIDRRTVRQKGAFKLAPEPESDRGHTVWKGLHFQLPHGHPRNCSVGNLARLYGRNAVVTDVETTNQRLGIEVPFAIDDAGLVSQKMEIVPVGVSMAKAGETFLPKTWPSSASMNPSALCCVFSWPSII